MSWKPRHETHAIDRVRILFGFNEPLTAKLLQTASAEIVPAAYDFGFDTVESAQSLVTGIQINLAQGGPPQALPTKENGRVLKNHTDDGALIEEVGFRDGAFGYVTTRYERWEKLLERLGGVLLPPLAKLEELADLGSIKLEYWDIFAYDGQPDDADATQVLRPFESGIPEEVVRGATQWHSHIGWFERHNGFPLLINQDFDAIDRNEGGKTIRTLAIHSMAELCRNDEVLAIHSLESVLDALHQRVAVVFGESLTEETRKSIGLDLGAYQ